MNSDNLPETHADPVDSVVDTSADELRAPSVRPWLVPNLLALIVCLPLGVAGVWFAVAAISANRRGEAELARRNARSARAFFWFNLVLGAMTVGFYLLRLEALSH